MLRSELSRSETLRSKTFDYVGISAPSSALNSYPAHLENEILTLVSRLAHKSQAFSGFQYSKQPASGAFYVFLVAIFVSQPTLLAADHHACVTLEHENVIRR